MALSIIYAKGSQVNISQLWCIYVPEGCFTIANSVENDEIVHYVAFHQGLHSLSKYPFRDFHLTCTKG